MCKLAMLKKQFVSLLVVAGSVCFLGACSSGSSSSSKESKEVVSDAPIELSPEVTTVSGEYGGAFTVADGTYELERDGKQVSFNFTMLREKSKLRLNADDLTYHSSYNKPLIGTFSVEFLDESGVMLFDATLEADSFKKLLAAKEGDKIGVSLSTFSAKKIDKVKAFRVLFAVEPNEKYTKETETKETTVKDAEKALKDAAEAAKAVGAAAKAVGAIGDLLGN